MDESRVRNRTVAAIFTSCLVMGVVSLGMSYWVDRQSERKWCATLTTLTEGYTAQTGQPLSERGRRLAANLAELRRSFHC